MKRGLPALLLLLAAQAGAQSFASMGRLFTTPAERAQLDAQRSQAPASALGANSGQGGAGGPGSAGAPGGTGSAESLPGMAGAVPCAAGSAPGCTPPPGMAAASPAGQAGPAALGPGDAGPSEQGVQEPPGLRLDGVIRRSNGPTVLIVNGAVQPAPPGGVTRGTVTLQADGHSIVLKPGQRYDPATGEVHEAAH
ncbi:hypothetical protein GM658_24330 [Pseudoduganella eburnea]|uniref:Uncharacterized protein n=1 Tax=Massilia eburnea TaxID=1776165 RepID=A0A6L6QNT2_9BURK|nr:hypothetical protein [Massilia eburnea]MTW13744.1 hypothetical protein [Massilia eburnea]